MREAGRSAAWKPRRRPAAPACAAWQEVLLEFAERREPSRDLEPGLDHIERCPDCQRDLAATALVLTALRRLADEAVGKEPGPGAWEAIRGRVQPQRRRTWRPGSVAGALAGAILVFAVVLPAGLSTRQSPSLDVTAPPRAAQDLGPARPSRGLLPLWELTLPDDPVAVSVGGNAPGLYPDNIRYKPVSPARPETLPFVGQPG